ncbi:hypothetical protein [Roseibium denhamense]|uniref:Uncharacterized protein n=1 Tax=Roseibium denhamense TaxID=76305 RepID=A0ABY1N9G3_9HYPH|nr:hypothetical protein [Roseibium denhamense]SMP04095.1 hypothetical protein SAMN06265374_0580 [Roseibium denhamense]
MRYMNSVKIIAFAFAFIGSSPALAAGMTQACYEKAHQPAVYKTIKRTVMTHRAHTHWEYRTIGGREVLCKVHRPAVYETVLQNVMVQPAKTVLRPISARDCNQTARITSNF